MLKKNKYISLDRQVELDMRRSLHNNVAERYIHKEERYEYILYTLIISLQGGIVYTCCIIMFYVTSCTHQIILSVIHHPISTIAFIAQMDTPYFLLHFCIDVDVVDVYAAVSIYDVMTPYLTTRYAFIYLLMLVRLLWFVLTSSLGPFILLYVICV